MKVHTTLGSPPSPPRTTSFISVHSTENRTLSPKIDATSKPDPSRLNKSIRSVAYLSPSRRENIIEMDKMNEDTSCSIETDVLDMDKKYEDKSCSNETDIIEEPPELNRLMSGIIETCGAIRSPVNESDDDKRCFSQSEGGNVHKNLEQDQNLSRGPCRKKLPGNRNFLFSPKSRHMSSRIKDDDHSITSAGTEKNRSLDTDKTPDSPCTSSSRQFLTNKTCIPFSPTSPQPTYLIAAHSNNTNRIQSPKPGKGNKLEPSSGTPNQSIQSKSFSHKSAEGSYQSKNDRHTYAKSEVFNNADIIDEPPTLNRLALDDINHGDDSKNNFMTCENFASSKSEEEYAQGEDGFEIMLMSDPTKEHSFIKRHSIYEPINDH